MKLTILMFALVSNETIGKTRYAKKLCGQEMIKSTPAEIKTVADLISSTRKKVKRLIREGKRVHFIWDFDGVLADSRSNDIFELTGFDLGKYFIFEERLLLEAPGKGPWLLPIAHNTDATPHFPQESFTQDIVTTRSSAVAARVYLFCLAWHLPIRWMLFLGHQPKEESYRMILKSFQDNHDYFIFCVDDDPKHIQTFSDVAIEEGMENRTLGIVSPIIRMYTEKELKEYFERVMGTVGKNPIRVRDPSDDMRGFIVLPEGIQQLRGLLETFRDKQIGVGHYSELRNAFVKTFGEVRTGYYKTEEELESAMHEFIIGLHCP